MTENLTFFDHFAWATILTISVDAFVNAERNYGATSRFVPHHRILFVLSLTSQRSIFFAWKDDHWLTDPWKCERFYQRRKRKTSFVQEGGSGGVGLILGSQPRKICVVAPKPETLPTPVKTQVHVQGRKKILHNISLHLWCCLGNLLKVRCKFCCQPKESLLASLFGHHKRRATFSWIPKFICRSCDWSSLATIGPCFLESVHDFDEKIQVYALKICDRLFRPWTKEVFLWNAAPWNQWTN